MVERNDVIKLAYTVGFCHFNYPDEIIFTCTDKTLIEFAKQVLKEFGDKSSDSDGR